MNRITVEENNKKKERKTMNRLETKRRWPLFEMLVAFGLMFTLACGDETDDTTGDVPDGPTGADMDDMDDDNDDNEEITTIILNFTDANSMVTSFEFDDPDGAGGNDPVIDDIVLAAGDYTLNIGFENRLEDPAEDIAEEVAEEDDEHQIFLLGDAVSGPASDSMNAPLMHAYADMDGEGNPVGLENTITAVAGAGELQVILRHLPDDQKADDLAALVLGGGLPAIADLGSNDVDVLFNVTVN